MLRVEVGTNLNRLRSPYEPFRLLVTRREAQILVYAIRLIY